MYQKISEFLKEGETIALATVISVRGSVPREVGAKMIIHPQGRHAGTVGGGCGEAEVMRAALDVLATGKPTIVSVDLTGEVSMESAAICGGIMDVFVERLPNRQFTLPKLQALLASVAKREPVALVTVVAAPPGEPHLVGNKAVIWLHEKPLGSLGLKALEQRVLADAGQALEERQHRLLDYVESDVQVFVEVQRRPPSLVIVGAGHIAQPLAEMGRLCDFQVTVLDDRARFANRQRFPRADQVIVGPMAETLGKLPLDRDTYVVLITRGHQHDVECLLELVDTDLAYLGMIGSRRRVRGVFKLLEEERGIPRDKLQRIYAPIGLDIGAKTPAEIALAIMAEVIKVYRGGKVDSLSDE